MHWSKETLRYRWEGLSLIQRQIFFWPRSSDRTGRYNGDVLKNKDDSRKGERGNISIIKRNFHKRRRYRHRKFSSQRVDEQANLDNVIVRFNLPLPITLLAAALNTEAAQCLSCAIHIRSPLHQYSLESCTE